MENERIIEMPLTTQYIRQVMHGISLAITFGRINVK